MKPSLMISVVVPFALAAMMAAQEAPTTQAATSGEQSATAAQEHVVNVRVVRLSLVAYEKYDVLVERSAGLGLQPALTNQPILQGNRLSTAGEGFAEVEFEDVSTLRVAPQSRVEFTQLDGFDTGAHRTHIRLNEGTVYLSLIGNKQDDFQVAFGANTLTAHPGAHVRVDVLKNKTQVVVYDGSARVEGPWGTTEVSGKSSLRFTDDATAQPERVDRAPNGAYDKWDREARKYYAVKLQQPAMAMPASFGLRDLNYYGSFADQGCGSMWFPRLVDASWTPYQSGYWMYYTQMGYTWVSAYPWGWLPYHSGSWANCGGAWGWLPGSAFYGYYPTTTVVTPPPTKKPGPPRPVAPPVSAAGAHPTLPVGKPPVTSGMTSAGFVFRSGSAGIGVPRGSVNLEHVASQMSGKGSYVMPVNTVMNHAVVPPARAQGNMAGPSGGAQHAGGGQAGGMSNGASSSEHSSHMSHRSGSTMSTPSSTPPRGK